jgi:hypothetical protein
VTTSNKNGYRINRAISTPPNQILALTSLTLGAGVTPAQGSVKPAAGFTLDYVALIGCAPSAKTNKAISALNQQQRDRSIKPQCDINGTLCGSP